MTNYRARSMGFVPCPRCRRMTPNRVGVCGLCQIKLARRPALTASEVRIVRPSAGEGGAR